ncbi:RNA 2',3'-cyclic phosphodiesterase [Streptomyces evansiae]|uniref:RNA 2',3'-cyclic phosphodiesterase n=1 Tax=Streptomyces evansiae TaxID=3075535 RepID=UPI002886E98F|nr:RNA 2',3'-cyclic phosphodiesterase [Streptomyces sp. DSM 41859]MDT0423261.1 RNA 2',3'-cyclic phosphodiesterase [Streptomyces sp. DSM 41859]
MRLFAALLPPPEALDELAAAVRPLRRLPGADDVRWTRPEGRHVTLAFYGDAEQEPLVRGLTALAAAHAPLRLSLAGGGGFRGGALWTGVRGDLTALHALAGAARALGGATEHAYRPHLSLARVSRRMSPRVYEELLTSYEDLLGAFSGRTWTADRVRLLRSVPGGHGIANQYVTEATYPLAGPAGRDG